MYTCTYKFCVWNITESAKRAGMPPVAQIISCLCVSGDCPAQKYVCQLFLGKSTFLVVPDDGIQRRFLSDDHTHATPRNPLQPGPISLANDLWARWNVEMLRFCFSFRFSEAMLCSGKIKFEEFLSWFSSESFVSTSAEKVKMYTNKNLYETWSLTWR
jgi:hypothetical protein